MVESVTKLKPATSKGIYLQKLHLSSTMGPGIEINLQDYKLNFISILFL